MEAKAILRKPRESGMSMEGVWSGDFVRSTGNMGGVVVPVARLVMSVRKHGQSAFGVSCRKLGLGPRAVERVLSSV